MPGPLRGGQQVVFKGPVLVAAGEVELAGLDGRGHLQEQQRYVERGAQPALRVEHVGALREREEVQRHLRAQSAESQKSLIARSLVEHRWTLDEWIEVEISSRRSAGQRRLRKLLAKVAAGDTVIVSELSRLGRSLREVLALIEELIHYKRCRLILVKQGLTSRRNHRSQRDRRIPRHRSGSVPAPGRSPIG